MTLVEKAQKVMLFKANIAKECKKRGMRMPTDEQISEFINSGYGMNLDNFMYDYTHFEGIFRLPNREPSPLEEITLKETLEKLELGQLKELLNMYVQDIGASSDNLVFDIADENDSNHLVDKLSHEDVLEIGRMIVNENARFIRIVDGKIQSIDIKENIQIHWPQIFDRVLLFPQYYEYEFDEGQGYFANIFAPNMIKMLGYNTDYQTGEVEYTKK